MAEAVPDAQKQGRLSVPTKFFYGFGSVAFGVKDQGFSYLLLIFYNQVVGLPSATVGLAIGLVQALTSVQEMTLTFVPKLGAILLVFWVTMSFSGHTLVQFYQDQVIPMVVGR